MMPAIVVPGTEGFDFYGTDGPEPDNLHGITDENPSPVLRVTPEGDVLYANPASGPLLQGWGVGPGQRLPEAWIRALRHVAPGDRRELVAAGGYAVTICPQLQGRAVYLYGRKL